MKILLIIIFLIASDLSQQQGNALPLATALKILGEPAKLTERTSANENEVLKERGTYTASSSDPVTGKTGRLYYNFEQYSSPEAASRTYHVIIKDNVRNGNLKPLSGIGDEAFIQSDPGNFHLVMARRGAKILRLKVNKITANTSEKALLETLKERIAKKL
jgi:hypothetical protein